MEEEVNAELEARLYAMIHYVDETQVNVSSESREVGHRTVEVRSTIPRYWRTEENPYQKVNSNKDVTQSLNNKNTVCSTCDTNKRKYENSDAPAETNSLHDLSVFEAINPKQAKKTIEIIENEEQNYVYELHTSDDDEVIEVELPPKPTITIESSDDETPCPPPPQISPAKIETKALSNAKSVTDREVSASPVPSVVSSVSDEFIRGDCIALNISSRRPDDHSFDFSLHGTDLLEQSTPRKKKKKKKSKDHTTSTPVSNEPETINAISTDQCFATPKSKAKNKKKNKSNNVVERISTNADLYDSDSNQSLLDSNKTKNSYVVTERSFPSADVYESDSSQSEINKGTSKNQSQLGISAVVDNPSNTNVEQLHPETPKSTKEHDSNKSLNKPSHVVDLTDEDVIHVPEKISENIVFGNVTGFTESEDYGDESIVKTNTNGTPILGSTKIPAILFSDLDFDNLKGKDPVSHNNHDSNKINKYEATIRDDMEKFYNDSWGGENFNHKEIQKHMSRDKSLWAIDPKDRMPLPYQNKRKVLCHSCLCWGHREANCRLRAPVCHMCGLPGHREPSCPSKICVNCGSPGQFYSTRCRACWTWPRLRCNECQQFGHPASHCPDLWRRYHNTTDLNSPLEECRTTKKYYQMYCSGCSRKGHQVHSCRVSLPFSGLPVNSPYVTRYAPLYSTDNTLKNPNKSNAEPYSPNGNKRQSKSPSHEMHNNKRRHISISESEEKKTSTTPQRKTSESKDPTSENNKSKEINRSVEPKSQEPISETAPDYIPIGSSNHDKNGCVIQDNEVSDTSEVITSARIYITEGIVERLKSEEGVVWLKQVTEKHNVSVEATNVTSFLNIKGLVANQEAFQADLRDWFKDKQEHENVGLKSPKLPQEESDPMSNNIPKNRNNVLRKLTKALESLKQDLGDPKSLYHRLNWLQHHHQQLLKQKIVSPKRLSNNRDNINDMLSKLNMVLLGQAGLAGGYNHLRHLYNLQEKLTNFRQKNIPSELRKEIGEHYYFIFAAEPRNDYDVLLKKYYFSKGMHKRTRQFENKSEFRPKVNKPAENIYQQSHPPIEAPRVVQPTQMQQSPNALKNELQFYHKKVLWAKPSDNVLKKTRMELVRKLHSHIGSLTTNVKITSKIMKKIKKTQQQVRLFLSNV